MATFKLQLIGQNLIKEKSFKLESMGFAHSIKGEQQSERDLHRERGAEGQAWQEAQSRQPSRLAWTTLGMFLIVVVIGLTVQQDTPPNLCTFCPKT